MDIKDLINKIDNDKNLLITGPAGTGKSTIIKDLKKHFGRSLILTSTTGVSALNIGGSTIHSFSGIGIHTDLRAIKTITDNAFIWTKVQRRVRRAHIIVIDEISMLRTDQLELIDLVFKEATGINKPFGGKVMVFVGDFLQLPPVVSYRDTKTNLGWIFNSKVWKDANIETVHLYVIHRQSDPVFLEHLLRVRFGWCQDDTDEFFKSRTVTEKDLDSLTLRFFSTNDEAEAFNEKNLDLIDEKVHLHMAEVEGQNEHYIRQIKSSTLALESLELKIGARVMFLNNNKEKNTDEFIWVNGSLGTIIRYSAGMPVVKIDDADVEVLVEQFTWKMTNHNGEVLAEFTQLPIKLAYGVTIHKSQGLTLSKAIIDCRRVFAQGQAYVALSRVRDSKGLYLLNWNPLLIKANPEAVDFYLKSMEENLQQT